MRYDTVGSGVDMMGLAIRKFQGVKASMPSSTCGKRARSLLFKQDSICVRTVVNSSKVNLVLPTIRLK